MQLYGILSENAWDKRAAMVMFRHRLKEAAGWFEEDQEIGGAASASSDQSSAGAANGRDLAP
ncbi:MAG: hypothetical protein K0S29_932 [Gammaproteobacteria bacterium]|nr:hypothetical protein [Gammaproteobacteria bacterium]